MGRTVLYSPLSRFELRLYDVNAFEGACVPYNNPHVASFGTWCDAATCESGYTAHDNFTVRQGPQPMCTVATGIFSTLLGGFKAEGWADKHKYLYDPNIEKIGVHEEALQTLRVSIRMQFPDPSS